jgi:hypothetical protein
MLRLRRMAHIRAATSAMRNTAPPALMPAIAPVLSVELEPPPPPLDPCVGFRRLSVMVLAKKVSSAVLVAIHENHLSVGDGESPMYVCQWQKGTSLEQV